MMQGVGIIGGADGPTIVFVSQPPGAILSTIAAVAFTAATVIVIISYIRARRKK